MLAQRVENYNKIEKLRGSKLLVYITGDRPGLETQLSPEALEYFVDHLDLLGKNKKISLFKRSRKNRKNYFLPMQ